MRSFCVVVFLLPPSYYFKGCCCLSYIIWSTWLVSAMKQDCGKPVCVEWYCSDLVGQIPTIVVLFKGKGCLSAHNNMPCLGRKACPQNIKVNYQIYYYNFFFISGILKCFLSSVAHLTSFEIRFKKKKRNPAHSHLSNLRAGQVMLFVILKENHHTKSCLAFSINTNVKLPILRLEFYLDVKVIIANLQSFFIPRRI